MLNRRQFLPLLACPIFPRLFSFKQNITQDDGIQHIDNHLTIVDCRKYQLKYDGFIFHPHKSLPLLQLQYKNRRQDLKRLLPPRYHHKLINISSNAYISLYHYRKTNFIWLKDYCQKFYKNNYYIIDYTYDNYHGYELWTI